MFNLSQYNAESYTETGDAPLMVDPDSIGVAELGIGVDAGWEVSTENGVVKPSLHAVEWTWPIWRS